MASSIWCTATSAASAPRARMCCSLWQNRPWGRTRGCGSSTLAAPTGCLSSRHRATVFSRRASLTALTSSCGQGTCGRVHAPAARAAMCRCGCHSTSKTTRRCGSCALGSWARSPHGTLHQRPCRHPAPRSSSPLSCTEAARRSHSLTTTGVHIWRSSPRLCSSSFPCLSSVWPCSPGGSPRDGVRLGRKARATWSDRRIRKSKFPCLSSLLLRPTRWSRLPSPLLVLHQCCTGLRGDPRQHGPMVATW
mmetsp:Transcript_70244/g.156481  ORF Transcript_70244/g.156481 Transcript_70244/m.156481 type:complete len:249 (-) Transcript_70244:122-868(-)